MLRLPQQRQVLIRETRRPAISIDQHVKRLTRRDRRFIQAFDLVAEPEGSSREFGDFGPNDQLVFVSGWILVAATRFGDDQEQTGLALHVAIRKAAVVAVLAPAYLKPNKIVRVVNHTHLVGLSIAHLHARLGCLSRRGVVVFRSFHLSSALAAGCVMQSVRGFQRALGSRDCNGLMINTQGEARAARALKLLLACTSSLLGYKLISVGGSGGKLPSIDRHL